MPQEFVARNTRIRPSNSYGAEEFGQPDGYRPSYSYERIAKIQNNFPVFDYTGPGVVAFMDPDNMEIAMPSHERTPYWSREHVLFHETQHVYAAMDGRDHDERGFNDMAVDALRNKTGKNFFPFSSY